MTDSDRLQKLEELLMHQERLLKQLHEVALELRADHDKLAQRVQQQLNRLESRIDNLGSPYDPDERPPHY